MHEISYDFARAIDVGVTNKVLQSIESKEVRESEREREKLIDRFKV